jgi:hypothetical protein
MPYNLASPNGIAEPVDLADLHGWFTRELSQVTSSSERHVLERSAAISIHSSDGPSRPCCCGPSAIAFRRRERNRSTSHTRFTFACSQKLAALHSTPVRTVPPLRRSHWLAAIGPLDSAARMLGRATIYTPASSRTAVGTVQRTRRKIACISHKVPAWLLLTRLRTRWSTSSRFSHGC